MKTTWLLMPVGLALGLLASGAQAQQLGGAQTADISIWRVLAALLFCLVLAAAAAFALRYRMTGRLDIHLRMAGPTRRMTLVDRLRLTPQAELCLVTIDGQECLLAVSPSSVEVLPIPNASPQEGSAP